MNTIYAHACDYAKRNLCVFPCHSVSDNACTCGDAHCSAIGKHPLTTRGVKDATTNAETLNRYFTGEYAIANIALATGEPSGVIVIDVDDPKALAALEHANAPLPHTWQAETGSGGCHYYFRFDQRCRNLKNAIRFAGALDVRTTGGYVLLPPSLHASGKRYRWLVSPDDCELATLPDWLYALMPAHCVGEGEPHANDNANDHANATLTPKPATTDMERASLYALACPPAISGSGGMNATFALCCRMVELFGYLNDDELLTALQAWNARCVPPWTEAELNRKLTDARTKLANGQASHGSAYRDACPNNASPTLHEDAYCGIVGEIVKAIEPETEADSVGVLVSLLAACGNAIGKQPSLTITEAEHHANLFICLIGDTASGKGQAWGIVQWLMKRIDSDWLDRCVTFGGLSSGEGLIEHCADEPPNENEPQPLFRIAPVKRCLCVEEEFAQPITKMRREGNTLSATLRNAWDAKPLQVMNRKGNDLKASNAFVSIISHITPAELRVVLAKGAETANGFANRFLWVAVRKTKELPLGGNISVLQRFIEPLRRAIAKSQTITAMQWSPEAQQLWVSVYPSLNACAVKVAERGKTQALRLAIAYALCDGSDTITVRYLRAALALWRYGEETALTYFDGDNLAIRLRAVIRQRPGIKRSELRLTISHTVDTPRFDSALRWLIERGDVVCVPVAESGNGNRLYESDRYYPAPDRQSVTLREANRIATESNADKVSNGNADSLDAIDELTKIDVDNLTEEEWRNELRKIMDSDYLANEHTSHTSRPFPFASSGIETETNTNNAIVPLTNENDALDTLTNENDTSHISRPFPLATTGNETKTTANDALDTLTAKNDSSHSSRPLPLAGTETSNATACTLAELIDWRNANSIRFIRKGNGLIWVSSEDEKRLTPALSQAILNHQETVSLFVSDPAYNSVSVVDEGDTLTLAETLVASRA